MIGKAICPVCQGNGFIRDKNSHPDVRKQNIEQCENCNSQGELPITDEQIQQTLWGSQRKQ
ncbi:MAG: hypothetical protein VW810_00150 [Pelagibacteraceae bacterium]